MDKIVVEEGSKAWEIAAVAVRLFAKKGYAGTRLLDIARAAGVGKSTLYEYFATKEDLFTSATYIWIKNKFSGLEDILADCEDPVAQLKSLGDHLETVVSIHNQDMTRMFVEFLQQSVLEGGVLFKHSHFLMQQMRKSPEAIEEVLLKGVAKGIFRPEIAPIADKLAINFMAFIDGIIFRGCMLNDPISIREHFTLHLDYLIEICLLPNHAPKDA